MSKLTLPFLLFLLVIWLIGATWWFNKKYDHIDSFDSEDCNVPFIITDGNFQTRSESSMIFEISNWEPTIPMQTLSSLKSVALYLANSEDKKLTLTGVFSANEINNSDFDNNGLARAYAVKNELIAYGAPEQKIITDSYELEELELTCGKIIGGVDFDFQGSKPIAANNTVAASSTTAKKEPEEIKEIKKEEPKVTTSSSTIEFSPKKTYKIFYDENTFKIEMNEELDSYFNQLAEYLKTNSKDRLLIMGHTDNVGSKDKHFNFGKYRARKLRDVLLEYGIQKRRIKTDSEGSSKPMGSNSTSEGRYQNRRVEISVIQR